MKIIIEPYNKVWKEQFESLRDYLLSHIQNDILEIVHVGSTSVPGLSAKPVIDLDIIIENDNKKLDKVILKLESLGYQHRGDLGISGREAFKRANSRIPITDSDIEWFPHHLYVCKEGCVALRNHLALKKHLLENPDKVVEYSNLKHKLADKFPDNMDAYIDGKTEFILDILKKEGMKSSEIDLIKSQNEI
ncbi:GrpB family protein [Marinigracilibium pacificum]|uniref:GrpB family protein n=1 Tax=Marinigracilibium pacificum TaxID=2729599 RepID=A0A848J2H3_9BACT|nr:GrpB family protein [Marinigracilibium pacificum]NMM50797.1 GrpB family protein [Marinigracilibium pacificum]